MKHTLTATLLSAAAFTALAQDAALERCRSLAAPMERLACYDAALPPRLSAPQAPARPAQAQAAASPAAPAQKPAPAGPSARPPAPTALAPTATPSIVTPPPPDPKADFGFESRRRSADDPADRVVTSFEGVFSGWGPAEKIRLANGQVWQIADGSQTAYDIRNPGVRIVRGAFGSFFMEIEGVSHSPKVRRVQ